MRKCTYYIQLHMIEKQKQEVPKEEVKGVSSAYGQTHDFWRAYSAFLNIID